MCAGLPGASLVTMGFGSPSLKGKALQWLAQREHSRAELQSKLLRHAQKAVRLAAAQTPTLAGKPGHHSGFSLALDTHLGPGAQTDEDAAEAQGAQLALERSKIEQILDDLATAGLQSDVRTAESVARSKSHGCGVHRLKQHLHARGLAPDLIAQTVGEARGSEYERAFDLWRRRYGEPATDPAERMRQVRFLIGRGFDGEVVRRVVRGVRGSD